MKAILVLTTADTQERAHGMAAALVEAGEAACVSIIPGIRSVYRWEGKVCDDGEWLLLIKTAAEKYEAVRARIRQMHSYQVPEIIALPIEEGDPAYLRWLSSQVRPGAGKAQPQA